MTQAIQHSKGLRRAGFQRERMEFAAHFIASALKRVEMLGGRA